VAGVCSGRMVRAAGRVRLVRSARVALAERDGGTGSRRAFELPVGEKWFSELDRDEVWELRSHYLLRLGMSK